MACFWRRLIKWSAPKVVVCSLVAIIGANAMLNLGFYPELLEYQSGGVAGREVKDSGASEQSVCFFVLHSPFFDFYSQLIVPFYRTLPQLDSALAKNVRLTVFTNEQGLDMLHEHGYFIGSVRLIRSSKQPNYRCSTCFRQAVTRVCPQILWPKWAKEVLRFEVKSDPDNFGSVADSHRRSPASHTVGDIYHCFIKLFQTEAVQENSICNKVQWP